MKSPSTDLLTRGIGGFLCVAAVLKVIDAFGLFGPEAGSAVDLVVAGIELYLGIALVFRVEPRISVPAAGFLFVALAGTSLLGTVRGVESCGCLGPLTVPPWVPLIVDVAAAGVLLSRARNAASINRKQERLLYPPCVAVFAFGMVIGAMIYTRPGLTADASSADAVARAKTVIINPRQLGNRPWSLLQYITIDADLSHGDWKVIMVRAGCRRCEQFLKSGACTPEGRERVAVVVAGDNEGWAVPNECQAVVGHLSNEKIWQFQAPMTLRLTDGR